MCVVRSRSLTLYLFYFLSISIIFYKTGKKKTNYIEKYTHEERACACKKRIFAKSGEREKRERESESLRKNSCMSFSIYRYKHKKRKTIIKKIRISTQITK